MPVTWTINALGDQWTSKTERGGKRTGTIVYQAIASEPSTPAAAEAAVAAAPSAGKGLTVGSLYPGETTGSSFKCVSRDSRSNGDKTRTVFIVTGEFDSELGLETTENPLETPMQWEYDPQDGEETYFKDTQGTPQKAIHTNGQPFDELPKRDAGLLILRGVKNVEHTKNYSDYESFIAVKLNNANVTIDGRTYAAGTLKAKPPKLSGIKELNSIKYRELSVELHAKADGWDQKYESRSTLALKGTEEDFFGPSPIPGPDGSPVTFAWPLNEDGTAKTNPTDPGFEIEMKPYERASFALIT